MIPSRYEPHVYVVDDDSAVIESLALLLQSAGHRLLSFTNAEAFLNFYQSDMRGCLLLDINLPEMNGLDVQSELVAVGSSLPVIFVTGSARVADAVQALKAGAFEFLEKPYNSNLLLELVDNALAFDRKNWEERQYQKSVEDRIHNLTPREMEVLTYIVNGHPSKVIALELNLSQRTVDIYRANVMQKMQTRSLATLVQMVSNLQLPPS